MSRFRTIYVVSSLPISFISIFTFISNHTISLQSLKQTQLFFAHFLEDILILLNDNVDEESSEWFSNRKVQP